MAHRSAAADDPEQSRSGGRRESEGARRLRRHRARGAQLGMLRRNPRGVARIERRRIAADPIGQARRCVQDSSRRAARADCELESRPEVGNVGALQRARSQGSDDVRPDDGRARGSTSAARASCRGPSRRSPKRGASITAACSPTSGFSPRAWAAWAARNRSRRRWRARRCWRSSASRRASTCALSTRYLDRQARDLDDALALVRDACDEAAADLDRARSATPPRSCPSSSAATCARIC